MAEKSSRTTRRDFLKGKSAVEAVGDLGQAITPESDLEPGPGLAGSKGRAYLVQVGRRAMACQFEVFLNAGQHVAATERAIEALDLVDRLEDQLSVYRHRSEVSRLNAIAQHRSVSVESRLFELLQLTQRLYEQTGGTFDVTSGPLIQLWRAARREGKLPDPAAIRRALDCVGSDKIALESSDRSVRFLEAGVTIDLGGIGKGYALDRCAEQLSAAELDNYLIHGGSSSVLARGSRQSGTDRSGWTVGVQHPLRAGRRLLELQLCDRAVGTSGAGTHQFYVHGKRYGHILDPRSGYPADGVLSSTVVAPLASVADALSTAFYVLGQEEATRYCAEHSEVSALIMTAGRRGGVDVHTLNCDGLDWNYVDPAEEAPADATDELASAAIRRPDSTARSDGERGPGG